MFIKDIGIDLGTANTLIYLRGRGIIIREPSVVAVNTHTDSAKYVGKEAKEVIGRTPGSMPTLEPIGSMIVDIGGGTSEAAVISLGGIISSKSIRCGGDELDAAIINHIRKRYNLLIGERTAEDIKIQIGSAFPMEREDAMEIKGRNLLNGLPETINITGSEVRDAMSEPLARIVDAIKYTLEQTPPDLSADIIDRGIILSGGGALLRGIDRLIHKETGMPVLVAEYPLDCVAEGTGKLFSNLERYQDAFMEDNRY